MGSVKSALKYDDEPVAYMIYISLATHPSSFILERLTALHVHIFGSVHMMETKIPLLNPPFHNLIVRPNFVCVRYNASDLLFFKTFRYMFSKKPTGCSPQQTYRELCWTISSHK